MTTKTNTSSTKIKLFLIFFLAVFTVAVFSGLEFLAFHFLHYRQIHPKYNTSEFRSNQPDPYANSAYFSKSYILSSLDSGAIFYTPKDTVLILSKDYDTEFIHVLNGDRVTWSAEQKKPSAAGGTYYFFGGSTMFSGEVPDYFTIPSLIAELNSNTSNRPYTFINKGVTSVNTAQQVAYLKTIQISPGDSVVFYVGVNDILQSLYFGNPSGTIIGEQRGSVNNQGAPSWYSKLFLFQAFLKVAIDNYLPKHLFDSNSRNQLLRMMRNSFESSIIEAAAFTRNKGANFYAFLQPNFFSQATFTRYEESLSQKMIHPAIKNSFEIGNPALIASSKLLAAQGVNILDISSAFDAAPEECYLDFCHVTESCNTIIAAHVFHAITGQTVKPHSRGELNTIHQKYVHKHQLDFALPEYKHQQEKLFASIEHLNITGLYGSFDKETIKSGTVTNAYVGFSIQARGLLHFEIETTCKEKNSNAEVTINQEIKNRTGHFSRRFLLQCGSNSFYYRLNSASYFAGLVINITNGSRIIPSIKISQVIN